MYCYWLCLYGCVPVAAQFFYLIILMLTFLIIKIKLEIYYVRVASVPLASAFLLFSSALGVLALTGKRQAG